MFSGRVFRWIIVPFSALGILLAIYFRELFLHSPPSTLQPISLDTVIWPPVGVAKPAPNVFLPAEDQLQDVGKPEDYIGPFHSHHFRDDGIVEVNPDGRHPIFELIDRAETRWQAKLNRASRSLEEAVREYKRRYRREPPKGFDVWWDYVAKHNVQLPDEYDQIWRDLEPFWGMNPIDLQRLQNQQESHKDTFTVGKSETDPRIRLLNVSFSFPITWENRHYLGGAEDFIALVGDLQEHIPPFRAVFSPHDSPTLFTDYQIKTAALEAAARGSYIDLTTVVPGKRLGWLSGCAPSSPARQGNRTSSPPSKKTFIDHHLKTMDPCLHPQILEGHGEFLVHADPGAKEVLVPQFAYCSTKLHHDIQVPLLLAWVEDILPRGDDPVWEEKLDDRLGWRGSNTGIYHSPETRWRSAQRARLVDFARDLNGTVKVLIPSDTSEKVGEGVEIPKRKLNPAIFDIHFAGEPVQCGPTKDFCDQLSRTFEWRKRQNVKEAGNVKYILDVDGNAWSSRFKRLITSNALIFKATVYPEWFYDRVEPWVHYVPLQTDYSDLHDSLLFFRGGLYGEGSHEDLARKIASGGRTWSKTFWRKEDITAYLFRLFLEYARVMSLDREALSYKS